MESQIKNTPNSLEADNAYIGELLGYPHDTDLNRVNLFENMNSTRDVEKIEYKMSSNLKNTPDTILPSVNQWVTHLLDSLDEQFLSSISCDITLWLESIAQSLKLYKSNIVVKILTTLSTDSDIAVAMYNSTDCFQLLLDQYFSKDVYELPWPFRLNTSDRNQSENCIRLLLNHVQTFLDLKLANADDSLDVLLNTTSHINCMNCIIRNRYECIKLIEITKSRMTIQIESRLHECVSAINANIETIERVIMSSNQTDTLFLFQRGISQSIFEILTIIYNYLILYEKGEDYNGPCPLNMLKIVENCFYLHSIIFPKLCYSLDANFANSIENWNNLFIILCYFSSFKLVDLFSCNCMGKRFTPDHISGDRELSRIIVGSTSTIFHTTRILKSNNSGKCFIDNGDLYICLSTLIATLMNITAASLASTTRLVSTLLSAIHQIFLLFNCHFQNINDCLENIQICDDFYVFLCRSCTWQPFEVQPGNSQNIVLTEDDPLSSPDLLVLQCNDIREKSILILNLVKTLISTNTNILDKFIETQLPSRLLLLLKDSNNPTLMKSVVDCIEWLKATSIGYLFQKCDPVYTGSASTEENNISKNYDPPFGNVSPIAPKMQEKSSLLSSHTSPKPCGDLSIKSIPKKSENSLSVSFTVNQSKPKVRDCSSIPWLKASPHPIFNISSVPPRKTGETVDNGVDFVKLVQNANSFQRQDFENQPPSINLASHDSLNFSESLDIYSYKNSNKHESAKPKISYNSTWTKCPSNINNFNITLDKGNSSDLNKKKSGKIKRNASVCEENHRSRRNIWSYMSNIFRSKGKNNRSIT